MVGVLVRPVGCQGGGYELRIIYCENAKQKVGSGGPGPVVGGGEVRVDANQELK